MSRKGQRFPSMNIDMAPPIDSSEDEGILLESSSPLVSSKGEIPDSEAYLAPCERRASRSRPYYFINESRAPLETAMSKIEFGVRSDLFGQLAFKTVVNQVDAQREIEGLKRVEGLPHVIQLLDTFEDDFQHQVLVLPVLRPLKLTKLNLIDVSKYTTQLLKALQGVHERNIVHMDVTPSNIMADDNGELVLIDFGLSTNLDDDASCTSCGTPGFIAPEVFEIELKLTNKVDIYSAGVVLGCMLEPYVYGCDLQFLGGSMVRASTSEEIVSKLDQFIARSPSKAGLSPPKGGSVYFASCNSGIEIPSIVYQAADLLCSMLRTDPEDRPEAKQLLQHPFLLASQSGNTINLFDNTDLDSFEQLRHNIDCLERQRFSSDNLFCDDEDDY